MLDGEKGRNERENGIKNEMGIRDEKMIEKWWGIERNIDWSIIIRFVDFCRKKVEEIIDGDKEIERLGKSKEKERRKKVKKNWRWKKMDKKDRIEL